MFANNGLIAAMEEVENELPVNEAETAEVAVAVADETAEVQKESDEAAVTVAQVEDAVQAGEELEEVAEVAVDAVESGEGLDETSAEMASIAIESIRNRLGFRGEQRLVPAMESFGNTNTRMTSTKLVIESIGDTIKKIWAAIKAAAARLWEKLKSFFAKLFNSASMLSKYIDGLRARARQMPAGVKPAEKKLKAAAVARAFSVDGKASLSSAKVVLENTGKMAGVAEKIGEKQKDIAAAASALASGEIDADAVKKFLAAQAAGNGALVQTMKQNFGEIDAGLAGLEMKGAKPKAGDKTIKVAFGPFVGSVALGLTVAEGEFLGNKAVRATMGFQAVKGKVAEEIEALELSEVNEILGIASKLALGLQDFKKVQGNYDAITKSIVKSADTVMNQAEKILDKTGSSAETRQGLQQLKTEINDTISTMGSFGNRAPALAFSCAKALADYASVSMRNLREGK